MSVSAVRAIWVCQVRRTFRLVSAGTFMRILGGVGGAGAGGEKITHISKLGVVTGVVTSRAR